MNDLTIQTHKQCEFVEITASVEAFIGESGTATGMCFVYCPHTTAGLTVNENADPDVVRDMLSTLERVVPTNDPEYRHAEGNSAAHVKASMMGFTAAIPIHGGQLALGRWQGIYLCEFDGPRRRTVLVRVCQTT